MNGKKVSRENDLSKVVVDGREHGILGRGFRYCETFTDFLREQGKAGVAKVEIVAETELANLGTQAAYMVEYGIDGMKRFAYVLVGVGTDDFTEHYVISSVRIPALEELGRNEFAKYRRVFSGEEA